MQLYDFTIMCFSCVVCYSYFFLVFVLSEPNVRHQDGYRTPPWRRDFMVFVKHLRRTESFLDRDTRPSLRNKHCREYRRRTKQPFSFLLFGLLSLVLSFSFSPLLHNKIRSPVFLRPSFLFLRFLDFFRKAGYAFFVRLKIGDSPYRRLARGQ